MQVKYDIHLAANTISSSSIVSLSKLGYCRDRFINLVRCPSCDYHATYRGENLLPNEGLWNTTCDLLRNDEQFSGSLEEESIHPNHIRTITGSGKSMPERLPPLNIREVPAGQHKGCDLHIKIHLAESPPEAVKQIEALGIASVDRETTDGIARLFTITCESASDGTSLFDALISHLSLAPNLRAKLKMETTVRQIRIPENTPVLPIVRSEDLQAWLLEIQEV